MWVVWLVNDSDSSDDDDDEDDEDEQRHDKSVLNDDRLNEVAEDYGVNERVSGYSYSRLLRYERREKEAERQRKAEAKGRGSK